MGSIFPGEVDAVEKKYRFVEYEDEQDLPFGFLRLNVPVIRPSLFLISPQHFRRAQKQFLLALRDFIDADIKRFES